MCCDLPARLHQRLATPQRCCVPRKVVAAAAWQAPWAHSALGDLQRGNQQAQRRVAEMLPSMAWNFAGNKQTCTLFDPFYRVWCSKHERILEQGSRASQYGFLRHPLHQKQVPKLLATARLSC